MPRWSGIVVTALAVTLAACSPDAPPSGTTLPGGAALGAPTSIPSTTTTMPGSEDFCLSGDLEFVDSGLAAALGDDVGDATQIEQIRLDQAPSCERITIEFTNGNGAPATSIGPTGISVVDFAGIVRITLSPEITTTAIADTLLEGSLVHSATVVREDDGSLSINIRGTEGTPIMARAFTATSPAALVVDVASSNELPVPPGVTASPSVVVTSPVRGPNLYPLAVDGYAAPGLHSVRVLLGTEDSTDVDLLIALDGNNDAWQAFSVSIVDGPSGTGTLFVGTVDTNNQPLEGASVSLDLP